MYELDKNVFAIHMALFFADGVEVPVLKIALKLQEEFKIMFPSEPNIMPLPIDAPKEIPRCTFRNENGASITVALSRMDFDAGIKVNTDWKNHISAVLLNFMRICETLDIRIIRAGVVVQALGDDRIIGELNSRVNIEGFEESEEKNISFVKKKQIEDILLNVVTNIVYNRKNTDASKVVSVDANTDMSNELPDGIVNKMHIIELIIDEIEGKLKNVF